ncbi:hypothetical protein [Xenorhabdus ehlersii]|uniref:Sulfurtransferase n=1 Tax=Xenorhabdus ehlersii TaxID=290111 RepID=A0A2D0IVX5_9GAMM|nr:hypothetical protein [Xenorhabdus ehlersii]PHM26091.1 sulfurtransferase [Xenorhabdus ehlersii]RKE88657.1 hypothetical protein BDE27_3301 [Xenorhabdus ehlersii]
MPIINGNDLASLKNNIDAANQQAENANKNANNRVPNSRKINGKQLTSDVTLNAGDVGALSTLGGTLTNNGNVLELKNTVTSSLYIQGTDQNGNPRWRVGSPGVSDMLTVHNVIGDTYVYIGNNGDVKINNNPIITGVRLGEMISTSVPAAQVTVLPDGHVVVGITKNSAGSVSHVPSRPIQYLIAGQWRNVEVFNG